MFGFFKSNDDKEIDLIVRKFVDQIALVGTTMKSDSGKYLSAFNIEENELFGRINFAFYHVQVFRIIKIVDMKFDDELSIKFGEKLKNKISADNRIGYGGFLSLCNFLRPENRLVIGNVGVKKGISHWIARSVLEIAHPSENQISILSENIDLVNNYIDKLVGAMSPKLLLDVRDRAALISLD